MKKIFFTAILLFCAAHAGFAQSMADNRFEVWMNFYYVKKDASKTGEFIKWVQDTQVIERKPNAGKPVAAFLSIIFASNPQRIEGWIQEGHPTGHTLEAIQKAVWWSGNQVQLAKLAANIPVYAEKTPPRLAEMKVVELADIDMMWGAFSASGDTVYVKKIIDVLDVQDEAIRGAAEWSLESNMRKHGLVYNTVLAEALVRKGPAKASLEKLSKQNEKL